MSKVVHILKDGKKVDDIKGHVVKFEDATAVYKLIETINQKKKKEAIA